MVVLDTIRSKLLTNLHTVNESTYVIKLNPPYDLMVDLDKILIRSGRTYSTRTAQ